MKEPGMESAGEVKDRDRKMRYTRKAALWIGAALSVFVVYAFTAEPRVVEGGLLLLGLCFACELIDSGLGMGYGTILTPVLLMLGYSPFDIVPTILLSELLSGFAAAFFHNEIKNVDLSRKGADLSPALLLASGSLVGVVCGVFTAVSLPKQALTVMIGSIILLSGFFVTLLSQRVGLYRTWKMLLLATVASFNKAVSGGGYGPLVTSGQVLSGVKGKSAVGITSFAEAFTCLVAVVVFLWRGGYINFEILVPMVSGALASVPLSVFAINKTSESRLKMIIGIVTMIMGAFTISKVIG